MKTYLRLARRQKLTDSSVRPPRHRQPTLSALLPILLLTGGNLAAGEADVVDVSIAALGDGQFRIDASVLHADAGWDHFANRWDVLAPDGSVIGSRELAHPHESEQPFTRSLTLAIPDAIKSVTIRAHDSVHELGGVEFKVDVPR